MKIRLFILLLMTQSCLALAQKGDWIGFEEDSIRSSLDGHVNKFHYYRSRSVQAAPLIIFIHQWSATYDHFQNTLAREAKEKGWNFIHPDLRGANNHPKACGSDYLISDIDETIDWAITNLNVDTTAVFIVGASGGGYNALCHFMKSRKHRILEYSVWVPITDLKAWYYESLNRNPKYADDILKCTDSNGSILDKKEALKRSPLYWETPAGKLASTKLNIYAGIHDGYKGAVPITHSLFFYNKLLKDLKAPPDAILPEQEMFWLLTTQTAYRPTKKTIGDRKVHSSRNYKNVSLSIFEGGHEILTDYVINKYNQEIKQKKGAL